MIVIKDNPNRNQRQIIVNGEPVLAITRPAIEDIIYICHWHPEWRCFLAMPFGTYLEEFTLISEEEEAV